MEKIQEDSVRLITTYDCPNNCRLCCNKQKPYRKENVTPITLGELRVYLLQNQNINNLVVTGGEPMMFKKDLAKFFECMKGIDVNTIIYSSIPPSTTDLLWLNAASAGVTISIHNQHDWHIFLTKTHYQMWNNMFYEPMLLDMRLKIMDNVEPFGLDSIRKYWTTTTGIKMLKSCPLPDNEMLFRLKNLW